ncbi:hypothetical protein [Caballeronia sp. LZ035]|uniref:hypothetical protein n=1 Tax=Caballeronia sp. LZ035 TaxID=3038568 RepID=UPI00285758BB|nr:hypothetical protein [Caballeronia sp. LZ035]MDR5761412.1 hypothetical protein [Caballeronia sp. LZ035]
MNSTSLRLIAAALIVAAPLLAFSQEVRNREANQQDRIEEGLQSGQITAHGANDLENREASINQARWADLAANGGHLTAGEQHRLNQRENTVSKRIHNDIAQPGVTPK